MRSSNLLEHIFLCLRKYMLVWLAPAIIFFVISGVYNKFLSTKTYTSRQSLILRDELLGDGFNDPSRFKSQESLKSAQETVLEIARKPLVVRAVLEALGPASSWTPSIGYPSDETIEDVQGNITLSAPNGGEFGKTEAVVLSVKSVGAERSREFMLLLLDEVDSKLNEVRLLRLGSMENELSQASDNAHHSLQTASDKLQKLEKSFGADITTIRGLNDPQGSGGFDLKVNQIGLEQRQIAAQLASAKNQRVLLMKASQAGATDFVTSEELLRLQPSLQGTMTNLSTAKAQLATNQGRYTSLHPDLIRSRRAVGQLKQQLFDSIGTISKGLDSQIETLEALDQNLLGSIANYKQELKTLTEKRVPYATLEEEVKKKAQVYNDVQGRLAQVMSYAKSRENVETLTRVDAPQVSSRPDQIGASSAAMLGGAIGLICGLGLVALLAEPFVDPRVPAPSNEQQYSTVAAEPARSAREAAPRASAETSAEARLKSVAAQQRSAAQSREASQPTAAAESKSPSVSSVRDHLAALSGASEKKADNVDVQPEPAPSEVVVKRAASPAASVKRREVPVPAEASSASAGVQAAPASSDSVLELTKQIQATRDKLGSSVIQDDPKTPAKEPAKKPVAKKRDPTPSEQSRVSAADVSAALRSLDSGVAESAGTTSSSTTPATPGGATPAKGAATSKGDAKKVMPKVAEPKRRKAISSFSTIKPVPPALTPRETALSGDRVRSPKVPESITNGRITAESLLESAKQKGSSDAAEESKFSSSAHTPAADSARIPSITDYARSLDQKIGSVGDQRIVPNEEAAQPNEAANTPLQGNMRPLDIARLAENPGLLPKAMSEVSGSEADVDATQLKAKSAVGVAATAAAIPAISGLVKNAMRKINEVTSPATPDGVAPSEKVAPTLAEKVAQKLREPEGSATIPSQIRELSDSFSSFARPTNPKQS